MYQVEHEGSRWTLEDRAAAVRRAQELSRQRAGNVVVSDERGFMRMVYRGGALDSFQYESPVTRSRRG